MKVLKFAINLVVAPLLLVLLCALAVFMIMGKKSPPAVPQKEVVISVAVSEVAPETANPTLETFGTTQSYFNTSVSSQVGGEIVEVSPAFEVGSSVEKGDWLAKINPADFEAALASRQAALASAQTALAEEETRSLLAREDWLAAGRSISEANDLTLRKPQLAAAKANVDSARAAVDQAKLDLERTTLRAPFAAIVNQRSASLGDVVSRGAKLGALIARERIQVRLPLTPSQASRVKLPNFGDKTSSLLATLTTPSIPNASWTATLNRVEPMIDPKNQSVYLIGEIENPFEDPNAFLPVGAFVSAEIHGAPIENVYRFAEASVVEDAFVWVVDEQSKLAKQPVEIVFSQRGQILTRIDSPLMPPPFKVLTLPLASLQEGQSVTAVQNTASSN